MNEHPKEWSKHLTDVQLAYNSAEHASTGVSPYELVYKEHPRSRFEMLTEKISPTTMEAKNDRIKGEAAELLRQSVESDLKASEKRRQQYNKKCSFKPLSIGSQVWKRNMRAKTFADRWVGPYVIIRPTSMTWTSYVIRLKSGRKEEIVHYNYLKPYQVRPEQVENPKKNPRGLPRDDPLSESSDDSEIEIRNNNDRRYPERRRRPPDRYTCD